MAQKITIAAEEQLIEIAGKVFTLLEMPGATVTKYLTIRHEMVQPFVDSLRGRKSAEDILNEVKVLISTHYDPTGQKSLPVLCDVLDEITNLITNKMVSNTAITEAMKLQEEARLRLFHLILPGVDDAFIKAITTPMGKKIIEIQDRLNKTDDIAKNTQAILAQLGH